MPTVEMLEFPASEAFLADPAKVASPSLGLVSKVEGCLGAYYGVQIDDKKTGLFVIVWDKYESHQKLIDAPTYPDVIEKLKPCFASDFRMMHVPFDNTSVAFGAPATEIAVIRLKEGKTKEELLPKIDTLTAELHKVCHPPSTWAETREYPGIFVLAIGWDSKEHHVEAVKIDPFPEIIGNLQTTADISLSHYALNKFTA